MTYGAAGLPPPPGGAGLAGGGTGSSRAEAFLAQVAEDVPQAARPAGKGGIIIANVGPDRDVRAGV